jgi:hypothetical protein
MTTGMPSLCRADGRPGLLADLVGQRQRARDGTFDEDVQDDRALLTPGKARNAALPPYPRAG